MKSRVLGNWQPSELSCEVIKQEFVDRVISLLGPISWSLTTVFGPGQNKSFRDYPTGSEQFHKDVQEGLLVVWSNRFPTVVKLPDGTILPTVDGDIILINNADSFHRMPMDKGDRWFVRLSNVVLK